MHSQQHPDPELLDRLHAGLLDEQPEARAALEQHVADCAACRQQLDGWQQLGPAGLGPQLDSRQLADDLQAARRRALNSRSAGHRHRAIAPYAAAAVLLLAVSAGLWSLLQPGSDTPAIMATRSSQPVPDVYEDLDFYLWLATQQDKGNGNEHSNPNNT
jgi:ferric-dicitrate binding protein FerR (iron transport regulator)